MRIHSFFILNSRLLFEHSTICILSDLKRFSETRWSKLSNVVEFPTGDGELNMSPYGANSQTVKYSLYGVCNHMGKWDWDHPLSLGIFLFLCFEIRIKIVIFIVNVGSTAGGHYVAACKHPITRNWNEFNDNMWVSWIQNTIVYTEDTFVD